jgi:hypothetical protein
LSTCLIAVCWPLRWIVALCSDRNVCIYFTIGRGSFACLIWIIGSCG